MKNATRRLSALARPDDIHTLPADLPVPEDDGAADHLLGAAVPPIALAATTAETVRLDELDGRTILFCYPRTGRPDQELPPGLERHSGGARVHARGLRVP